MAERNKLHPEEEGREFTEEDLEALFHEAEEEEPPRPLVGSPRFRKWVGAVLAVMLCAQVLAFWPRVFSLEALRFLSVSAQLSRSEEIREYKQSVVVIRAGDSKGTGFIVSEDGWVVTNHHVVKDAARPVVSLPNGANYVARVAAVSEEADLALLDLEAQGLPVLQLAEHVDGEKGVPIYIIGNPLFFNGIANEGETLGWVSGADPPVIALKAPVYRGNSGSPVIARNGEVIGVVYAASSIGQHGKKAKIGLAVPVDRVRELMAEAAS